MLEDYDLYNDKIRVCTTTPTPTLIPAISAIPSNFRLIRNMEVMFGFPYRWIVSPDSL